MTWDKYIEIIKQPEYEQAKCYYYNGQLRIEMAAVGPDHADDRGSERLTESEVLPGLKFALLEEGLRRSRETDHTEVGSWFLEEIR